MSLCFLVVFQDRVSLSSPGCPGIYTIDQVGLASHRDLLCLPGAGIKSKHHYHLTEFSFNLR